MSSNTDCPLWDVTVENRNDGLPHLVFESALSESEMVCGFLDFCICRNVAEIVNNIYINGILYYTIRMKDARQLVMRGNVLLAHREELIVAYYERLAISLADFLYVDILKYVHSYSSCLF